VQNKQQLTAFEQQQPQKCYEVGRGFQAAAAVLQCRHFNRLSSSSIAVVVV